MQYPGTGGFIPHLAQPSVEMFCAPQFVLHEHIVSTWKQYVNQYPLLTAEVLPSIRKIGGYALTSQGTFNKGNGR